VNMRLDEASLYDITHSFVFAELQRMWRNGIPIMPMIEGFWAWSLMIVQ
jgi:hypothetical protein